MDTKYAETITYLRVTAPAKLWEALYHLSYRDTGEVEINRNAIHRPEDIDALVYAGRAATGSDDWRAISWAICEKQRREEAKTIATAIAREAESIGQLAAALKSESEASTVQKILRNLTERTQYALKQQLKGKFGL
jgi:hypothetical protein